MKEKYEFRQPLVIDKAGLYVTVAQIKFFLNRRNGKKKFSSGDKEFVSYYRNCCLYNMVYDMMNMYPDCATMYWDTSTNSPALSFPIKGDVALALTKAASVLSIPNDDDDPYGIFQNP
jgi:hypothetical protein